MPTLKHFVHFFFFFSSKRVEHGTTQLTLEIGGDTQAPRLIFRTRCDSPKVPTNATQPWTRNTFCYATTSSYNTNTNCEKIAATAPPTKLCGCRIMALALLKCSAELLKVIEICLVQYYEEH
ncbi:unnamed protein product [Ceratitis capitata]|uniref:(Mediterranean fruit fly) hypothetical protein n=1 Tax=Ceratitis capitata TaxID=7213 RepID=A0A811U7V4_CERCA|nr:unnamed protein product [Ceratitis capitata]